ncbi:uncharacterized protein LOC129343098 isoform X2 [Eublepharis macularius]|uniref:Uncharacterized protein LOC129343098 isoform X2 n=1 Tax=Eublepharis macularius TaxID=481883 RepID=A0AA97LGS3_EUBMA|nr:uncharacterized protein LOC129343098 isoform X2 [Eublepharis macularius]
MAARAGLNLNMSELARNGIQWALSGLFQSLIVQVKRILIFSTTVIMSSVLLSALWLAVQKADYSLSKGEHEVTLSNTQKWAPHSVIRILRDFLQYAAIVLSSYEPLSLRNLLRHRDQLNGVNYMLQACFNEAIDGFNQEPLLVQENSKMVIHCDGQTVQFLSGTGDCEISVYVLRNSIQYDVRERTAEMYLARLSSRQEPLSIRDLLRVKSNLQSWGVLSEELQGCLEFAVQEYSEEPLCVQDNANMVVDCGGQVLKFASGRQDNAISIYDVRDGTIHYQVRISSLWASTVRFFKGNKDHTYTRRMKRSLLD